MHASRNVRAKDVINMQNEDYMKMAIVYAKEAFENGEVPVGCVITDENGEIIGTGRNRREQDMMATAHAEIEAIEKACRKKRNWRLQGCTIYITLEPCPMCAGAIINSRISRLVYGAKDENTGSCGSVINLFMERYGHSPQIFGGIMEDECAKLLSEFFQNKRKTERKG